MSFILNVQAMYCCEKCRTEASNSYHEIECGMILFYDRAGVNETEQAAMRAFLTGTKKGTDLPNLMQILKPSDIFEEKSDTKDEPFVNDYCSILKLLRKFDDKVLLIKKNVFVAVEAIIWLLRLNFFQNKTLPVS